MKTERQNQILRIIQTQAVETQEELVEALRKSGWKATQATISRDVKELQLVKVASERGGYRYAVPQRYDARLSDRMVRILSDTLVSADYAGHMVVVKTMSGSANVAGEVLDTIGWTEILGTIAGDNTILVIVRHEHDAEEVVKRLVSMIRPQE